MDRIKDLLKRAFPPELRRYLRAYQKRIKSWPKTRLWVSFGSLRTVKPVNRSHRLERGTPIDIYYTEKFLQKNIPDIKGRVLEAGHPYYAQRLSNDPSLALETLETRSQGHQASLLDRSTTENGFGRDLFDCMVITRVFSSIYEIKAAINNSYQALKPGGVLLATLYCIYRPKPTSFKGSESCWGVTTLSAKKLFEEVFPSTNITVRAYGNVFTAISFLQGLGAEELKKEELDYFDPDYEVLVTVRAVK